ncbi:MAG: RagB/SusD family nutrient uptake outer membrane protein [Prevotella sp.]|nr:RagB/SusD family nutrient uptake outer membrane protein [Prevotella sp.]
MKKTYIAILIMTCLGLGMNSCEDRLDIAKHGNMGSQETFYSTDEEAEQALASLYISFRSNYFNWFFLKNLLSDDVWCGGGSRGDNAEMEKLNEYTFGTDHSIVQSLYSGLYSIIYKANLIIDQVEPSTTSMQRCIAEARFFRAWAHFELVTLWGTAPVVDHLLSTSEYRPSNSTSEDLWTAIETDLTTAIDAGVLPSKSDVNDQETGIRITKETAEAYLGKAYLFQAKYTEAAQVLEKVIQSGKYALYTGDYDQLLHAVNNNCCESMLEAQLRNDSEQAWAQMTMLYLMQGWRTDKLLYSGQASTEIATGTYGFLNPRKSLYDAFVAEEGADGYRLNSTLRTYDQMQQYGISIQPGAYLYGNEGYFMWKTRPLKADCIMDAPYFQALQYNDMRVMRYAEVLLMAAEAYLQAGNQAKALEYINMIRTRAKLASLTSVTLQDVKNEKQLELCLESVRYQDLVRWGDAQQVLGEQGQQIPSLTASGVQWNYKNDTYGYQERNKLLPIPLKEIELNPNITQNEGWQ